MTVQQSSKFKEDTKSQQDKVAIPVEVRIELAKMRLALADVRYEINIRKGGRWVVHPNSK